MGDQEVDYSNSRSHLFSSVSTPCSVGKPLSSASQTLFSHPPTPSSSLRLLLHTPSLASSLPLLRISKEFAQRAPPRLLTFNNPSTMATMFASDFSFSSASSTLPLPDHSSSSHSPITPLDVIFATSTSPSHSNFYSSAQLNSTDDDDEGGARAIVVSTGRRMSKSTKIPPKEKMSFSPSNSSYTSAPIHHFNDSPPPSYSTNERSHQRKSQPTPLELYASPTPTNEGRSRSSYFPTSPTSSGSRRGMSVSGQGSEAGAGGHGRRMSTVVVGMERRSSVDQEKEDQRLEKKRREVAAGPGTIGFESCIAGKPSVPFLLFSVGGSFPTLFAPRLRLRAHAQPSRERATSLGLDQFDSHF